MSYNDVGPDDLFQLDPPPDDAAWETYLDFVMPILGSDDSLGLTAGELALLEEAVGATLPYEIGLFLTIGTPADSIWWRWKEDPEAKLDEWRGSVTQRLGEVPADVATLLPLAADYAVVLGLPRDSDTDEGNPVFRIIEGEVLLAGVDLAAWLHTTFDVPLPMWPPRPDRDFGFWTAHS